MFSRLFRYIGAVIGILLITACGMKGPLEHPKLTSIDTNYSQQS